MPAHTLRPAVALLAVMLGMAAGGCGPGDAPEPAGGPAWPEPPVKLLMLGTFHFTDAGLDSYRPKYDVDVLTEERQAEVAELLDRLAAFAPNKIAVEWPFGEQPRLDARYASFRDGALEPVSDELYQLGFRLADRLGHDRVYAVDAKRRFYEPWVDPDEYAAQHGQTGLLDDDLWELYESESEYRDELKTRVTLGEFLLFLNERDNVLLSHGQYLIGNFEVGDAESYPGVDAKTAWYNRNLKIFANLQRIADMRGDRILLIVGAGHVPILRHAAEASPQFELVEVSDVL